jgi:hypothetical protein
VPRTFVSASSQYLEASSSPVVGKPTLPYPFSIACWFSTTSITTAQCMVCMGTNTVLNQSAYLGITTASKVAVLTRSSTATHTGSTSTLITANTWSHACGVWLSDISKSAYLNGGGKGTHTGATAPDASGWNRLAVGRIVSSSPSTYFSGPLALAAVWDNYALSASEIAALAGGAWPEDVAASSLVGFWPLWGIQSPEIDLSRLKRNLTVTGATLGTAGPPVRPYSRRFWGPVYPTFDTGAPPPPPPTVQEYPAAMIAHL